MVVFSHDWRHIVFFLQKWAIQMLRGKSIKLSHPTEQKDFPNIYCVVHYTDLRGGPKEGQEGRICPSTLIPPTLTNGSIVVNLPHPLPNQTFFLD